MAKWFPPIGISGLLLAVLLLYPALPGTAVAPQPTRTARACHICDEGLPPADPVAAVATPTPGQADALPPLSGAVVRAVMFWMDTCSRCHEVIENVLPPLQQQYGAQLVVTLVEIHSTEEFERLYPLADSYGLDREWFGVPFLLIGEQALLGPDQIAAELPGLIETYLAVGGVDYPDTPGLAEWLPAATAEAGSCAPGTSCEEPAAARPGGFGLAIAVMAGMAAALVYSAAVLVRAWRGRPPARRPAWLDWAIPALVLLGLGVAGYLAYVETRAVPAVCGPVGDCNAVQNSAYARLFGVLPVGVFGVLGYLAILATWLWGRFRSDKLAGYAPLALCGLALFGTLFSLYLTYLEPFVIRAVCSWCLTSAASMAALLLLTIGPAAWRARELRK